MTHPRRSRQRGQALLEGALVTLTFITCLLAILELGRYMLFIQYFTERARAGARYSAVSSYNTDQIKNWVVYNSSTAPQGGGAGLFGLTTSMITVNRYNANTDTDTIEVSINNYPMTLFIPLLPQNWTLRPFKVVMTAESLGATN